jgi:hypothetical protein
MAALILSGFLRENNTTGLLELETNTVQNSRRFARWYAFRDTVMAGLLGL